MEKLMKINKYLSGIAASAIVVSCASAVSANAMQTNTSKFTVADSVKAATKTSGLYIIQMKGAPAIAKASAIGELTPSNQLVATIGNNYNATTPKMRAYVKVMKMRQAAVASQIGVANVLHNYAHTFNGFSARLTPSQAKAMRSHPDVAAVYEDELHQMTTSNTPAFLGLTGPGGQHTLGIKGEDVIVGILDSGIWPENPSFSENSEIAEMAYGPAPARWAGACNVGSIGEFTDADGVVIYNDETMEQNVVECDNKLIGARYFGSTFSSQLEMQFALGEFASARDADGHGSHTASTAAGNAGVTAVLQGAEVGLVSGIAPRARVAAYKVCWNSNFVNEAGDPERGCFFGDSMAAIDQAVVDGVDVLNYSIGNSIAINSPVYNAALRAAEAGVFFSASAGNSGPGPETVNNIAPWIATVAASTYDGQSALIGSLLDINSGTLADTSMFSIQAGIAAPVPEGGFSGDLALADPVLACDPLTNDLTGQVAVIARGACAFDDKFTNAVAAGAVGVVVYTDGRTPISMGGDLTFDVPGVMITNADGLSLSDSILGSDGLVNVTMTNTPAAGTATEVGNIMAGFSSRGVNAQTNDILKPDITAPGVRILAASSPEQLQFGGNPQGENFAYLQGTSMSSPHIAGMAALLAGQHPSWSPAQIKSAMMTSARQDLVKEDALTPADPFDFGAGHVDPVPAMNPGLTYNANFGDYLGFLCGQGEEGLVVSLTEQSCAFVEGQGFAVDASQLNYPSIAIGELIDTETISRTVTDVSNEDGVYTVTVDAPAGI
ncbi:MAG: subtilisin family serine protease, partial [Glaciecola sp.]